MSCLKKKFIPTIENMLKHIDDTFFDISNDNVIEKYKQLKEKMNSIEGEKIFKKILVSNESVDKDTITIAILVVILFKVIEKDLLDVLMIQLVY